MSHSSTSADRLPEIPGFQVLERIGGGAMGVVYLARQLSLKRNVAIKILSHEPTGSTLERFEREAQLMARISHPNVVAVFDVGVAEGHHFLVMEHIEGGDLRQRMNAGEPMSATRVLEILRPITNALAVLHRAGIVHRDLKPENILIHGEDNPKVSDFGIAVLDEHVGNLTVTGERLGTVGYASPEQRHQLGNVDERSDQYSLAAIAYELLTGRAPTGVLRPPSHLNRDLGRHVDAVLLRGLHEDPDERFPCVGDFTAALEKAIDKKLRRARPVLPRLLALSAGLTVAVIAGAIALRQLPSLEKHPTPLTNSIGMSMVLIHCGEFLMGSPESDPDAKPNERPQRKVRITQPFFLSAHEVTVGQFRQFVEETGYQTCAERGSGGYQGIDAKNLVQSSECNWRTPEGLSMPADNLPVTQVSWSDAVAFCQWLTEKEGVEYRLPTEAEWEYACRAGTTEPWSCVSDELEHYAWFKNLEDGVQPVGTRLPNSFGLFDMHGNVAEWCQDWLAKYQEHDWLDPKGPDSGKARATRGGAYHVSASTIRSACRMSRPPDFALPYLGFRVLRVAP